MSSASRPCTAERVVELRLDAVGPHLPARLRVDELARHHQLVAGGAHAALHRVAHAELAADGLDRDVRGLVGGGRAARDHEQGREAAERGRQVLGEALGEEGAVAVRGEVAERQHRPPRARPGSAGGAAAAPSR